MMGHRASEWLGLGPHIEEDIAFASIAQDELGHAAALYRLLQELGEGDADELAFGRPAEARLNAQFCERENGSGSYLANPDWDWATFLLRFWVYDEFDKLRLGVAARSSHLPLAQLAAKIAREERFHRLHHETWIKRLAGTVTGRERLVKALPAVWADAAGLFSLGAVASGPLFPATPDELWGAWIAQVVPQLRELGLIGALGSEAQFALTLPTEDGRQGQHTPALTALLNTMGEVRRTAPGASW
jgi:ring-1,2-phenylacetyl-CoA epoxidase subunit PaaC